MMFFGENEVRKESCEEVCIKEGDGSTECQAEENVNKKKRRLNADADAERK